MSVSWFFRVAAALVLSALVLGCSEGEASRTATVVDPAHVLPTSPAAGDWQWEGLVLGVGDSATACFGGIGASLPPSACVGWPIRGWQWADVEGVTELGRLSDGTVRQVEVRLTVRVDGDALRLVRPIERTQGMARLECRSIGNQDPVPLAWDRVEALLGSTTARQAGLFSNNAARSMAAYVLDAPARLELPVLADTSSVRAWLHETFGDTRIDLCPSLRPASN